MDPISLIIGVLSLIFTAIGAYIAWHQWRDSRLEKPITSEESAAPLVENVELTGRYPVVSIFTGPPTIGRMIGRDALVKNLVEDISTRRFNALVIEGIGGIGKTSLAATLAELLGAVMWINCDGEEVTFENFSLSIVNLALKEGKVFDRQVFFSPNQSNSAKTRGIIRILSAGEHRIVFDDFHLVKDQALKTLLQVILERCPEVTLILTTRVRLKFLEDANFRILPKFVKLEGLGLDSAMQYLRDLGEIYPKLRSTDDETLKNVWQYAGMGHPIALKVFAMLTRYHPVANLLDEPGQYYDRLNRWIEKLFKDLSADEVLAIECLSIFREPVSEKAIFHLLSGERSREVLNAIIDRFLVEGNMASEFYLHPLLRDYTYSKLLTPEQAQHYHRLAGTYFEVLEVTNSNDLRNELKAYHHYRQAGASESVVRSVRKMKKALFDTGQYGRLSEILMEIEPHIYESIAEEAIKREPILFLGGGEVAHVIATALDPTHYVTIIVDRRLSVASRDADFQIFLDKEGFRKTDRIVAILQNISRAITSNSGAHLPSVITDYYGFDAEQVFNAAEDLGYRILPNKIAALVAADKVAFWEHFRQIPEIAPALIPRTSIKIPQVVAHHLLAGNESSIVKDFVSQVKSEIRHVGLPCVFKLANSELGYGQSVIRANEEALICDALHFAVKQSHEHGINPADRIILEKEIPQPFYEAVQIATRHFDPVAGLQITFAPPILVGHVSQEILFTDSDARMVRGPFVLDFAIQCDICQMPSLVQTNISQIQALAGKMVDSLGASPGIYGVSFFITESGIWIPDDIPVKAEDTMFVTKATQLHSAAEVLTICLAGKPIQASAIQELQFAGGTRTILWRETRLAELERIVGKSEAGTIPGVYSIETYDSKIELRPLRLMGIILVRLPQNASLTEIESCLDEASSKLRIIPR